jgi:hypothetical protein
MNKEFIPYEQALELKELGFDEECLGWYPNNTAALSLHGVFIGKPSSGSYKLLAYAPLYQQAFRWFREKHNTLSTIYANASGFLYEWEDAIGGTHRGWSEYEGPNDSGCWDTYEEAELACLKKLIEIVKNK